MTDTTSGNAAQAAPDGAESADDEATETFGLEYVMKYAADHAVVKHEPTGKPVTSANASANQVGLDHGFTPEELQAVADRIAGTRALDAVLRGEPMSDLGNARRLCAHAGDALKYVPDARQWIAFDGKRGYWVPSEDGSAARRKWHEVTEEMKESGFALAAGANGDEDTNKAAKALVKFALQSQSGRAINSAVDIASTLDNFRTHGTTLDAAPHLLQCANGVVNLDTGELMPSNSAFLHTRSTAVPYVKGARSPLLDGFFNRMFGGDTAKVEWFRALVKASLYGGNVNRLVVVLQGKSNSGKTTTAGLMKRSFGGYQSPFSMSILRGSFDEKPRPDLVRVLDYRIITTEEISLKEELHADQIKRLASGDGEISVRTLYQGETAVKPKFTPWLMVNVVPAIAEADQAVLNRLRIVTTSDAGFTGKDVIPLDAPEVHEAFLAWIIEGAETDFADRADIPESALDDQQSAEQAMYGPLGEWIAEECITGSADECWAFSRHLYASAKTWYEKNSIDLFDDRPEELKNERAFGMWLQGKQYENKRKRLPVVGRTGTVSKAVYHGIGLKTCPQPPYDPAETR